MNDKNKKTDNKKPIKPLQKGRYAEKLNLKMDFNEAVKKAVNTKINDKKDIHTPEEVNLKRTEKEILLANGFEFIPFEKIEKTIITLLGRGMGMLE
jgi:hypothetical protein